jgi:uncharacterized protein YndB with AHSA1/START domain
VKTIIHVVEINVPREQVYAALTTQKGLAGWWTTVVKTEERIGGVIEFTFDSEFGPRMKIVELQPLGPDCETGAGKPYMPVVTAGALGI